MNDCIKLTTPQNQPWELWSSTIGSVGRLLPNQTAKYISPSGTEVPVGQAGELCLRGPNIYKGYHNNPAATKASFTPDGFFKTGDVGYQDAEGNFYITDRVKELIKYKGFQVAPAELEGLLVAHPQVDDVAVIGVYDKEQASEVPRAYLVLRAGAQARGEDIQEWVKGKVSAYKRLRGGVRFVDSIPKSASGKILRRVLKAQAAAEEDKKKQQQQGGNLKAKL